jgi:Sec-independent protein translocase protein TatA
MNRGLRWLVIALAALTLIGNSTLPAVAADTTKVDKATKQVESGAKKIGEGKVGEGVEETAKGIGNTVVEGAKVTGEKFKEAGKAAEPPAKTAWEKTKEGATSFGTSVKNFFNTLFGGD